jgi:hypothetical protein
MALPGCEVKHLTERLPCRRGRAVAPSASHLNEPTPMEAASARLCRPGPRGLRFAPKVVPAAVAGGEGMPVAALNHIVDVRLADGQEPVRASLDALSAGLSPRVPAGVAEAEGGAHAIATRSSSALPDSAWSTRCGISSC